MIDRRHYQKGRLPHQKRTIRVRGQVSYNNGRPVKDQSDSLFRCWNCGFLCNEQAMSSVKTGDGVGYHLVEEVQPYTLTIGSGPNQFPGTSGTQDVHIIARTISTPMLMQLDAVGDYMAVEHVIRSEVKSGCPFCGSKNYR